jgi:hypothetical protein
MIVKLRAVSVRGRRRSEQKMLKLEEVEFEERRGVALM